MSQMTKFVTCDLCECLMRLMINDQYQCPDCGNCVTVVFKEEWDTPEMMKVKNDYSDECQRMLLDDSQ